MADLEGEPFVLREPGSGTREQFEAELEHRGIHVRAKWVCHSADSILEAVARGQGLSVISRRLAEQALPIINIPPQSGGYFRFGHSPNTTGNAQVRFLLACQPRIGLLATRKRVSGIVKTYLITFSIHL